MAKNHALSVGYRFGDVFPPIRQFLQFPPSRLPAPTFSSTRYGVPGTEYPVHISPRHPNPDIYHQVLPKAPASTLVTVTSKFSSPLPSASLHEAVLNNYQIQLRNTYLAVRVVVNRRPNISIPCPGHSGRRKGRPSPAHFCMGTILDPGGRASGSHEGDAWPWSGCRPITAIHLSPASRNADDARCFDPESC